MDKLLAPAIRGAAGSDSYEGFVPDMPFRHTKGPDHLSAFRRWIWPSTQKNEFGRLSKADNYCDTSVNGAIALCTPFCGNQIVKMLLQISMETVSLRNTEPAEDFDFSSPEQVYVRSQAVISRRIAGETLIVPVRGKVGDLASIYSFNQTGSLIWRALESPKRISELISIVEQEYVVDRSQAALDVRQFLREMLSAGLIRAREEVSVVAMNQTTEGELHTTDSR